MFRNVRIIPALLSAGLVVLEIAFMDPARAASVDASAEQKSVSYTDLNLERAGDVAKLYERIERAANRICHAEVGPAAKAQAAERQCVSKSVAEAVANVSHPNLTALYTARTGSGSRITARR